MVWTQRLSGQNRQRGPNDFREPYERDRTRVIHSAAFRRLQQKTQIYGGHAGNFHRTRLTHSLEVASIGMSLVRHLRCLIQEPEVTQYLPADDLIYVICLLHDIGHPPFGHGGEAALNALMFAHGGFEGNAQSLRLVTNLETAYQPFGLDLTRRTLLGILKYPVARESIVKIECKDLLQQQNRESWVAAKGYYVDDQGLVDWILEPFQSSDKATFQSLSETKRFYHSLDCSLMDIADDIAYGVHDLEDAIHMRLIVRNHLESDRFRTIFSEIPELNYAEILEGLFSFDPAFRKQTIGALVHYFVSSVYIENQTQFSHPLLKLHARLSPQAHLLLKAFIHCVYDHVIDSPPARAQEFGSQNVLIDLFDAIHSNPHRLLDSFSRTRMLMMKEDGDLERIICDCLANLSDDAAIRLHRKLFADQFSAEWANHLFD
ncbi:MAG: dNTP triphosphohydrolase [Gammaproteobacteria bacterium]|nr:dNTP triphosphohydrolase [Gammaproteobacteria bacterium]